MRLRLEEMVRCGISIETAELMSHIIIALGADTAEWSVFASLDEDPASLQLWHEATGRSIDVRQFNSQ